MKTRILAAFALVLVSAVTAHAADPAPWRVVQTEDGSLYLLKDGHATPIQPAPISSDQLGQYQVSDQAWLSGSTISFQGKGGLNTAPVAMQGDYQITWSTQSQKPCLFDAQFKPTGQDYVYTNDFGSMDLKASNSGSTYVYSLPGETYYLYVNSNCDGWNVQAQPL